MNAPPVDDDDRSRDGLQAVARGGVLNLVTAALGAVLGFFLVILVGRGLGPSGAGVFFTSIGLFTILSTILELGAPMALVRSVAARQELETPHDLPLLASISIVPVLVIGTVVAIAAYVLIDQIVSVLFSPAERSQGAEFLRVLIPFIPLAAGASVALGGTRGFGSMVPFVLVRNLGKPILRPILTGAAILAGLGASAIALAWVIPAGLEFPVALLAFLVLLRRATSGVRGSREGDAPAVRRLAAEFWRFAAPRGVAATFQTLVLWMDVLLVGAMTSTRQAGIYATASRFVLLGTLAIEAVRLAIAPQLGAMFARNDLAGAQRMYGVATWWLMVPSWPVYVVIAAFAPVFLRLFGAGFGEAQDVLVILSIAMLFNIGTGNVTVVLLMAGKSVWNLGNALIAFVINLGLNLLLIPRFGITGAAVAWTASIVWENLAPLVQIRRAFGLTPFGRGYVRVAAAALVVFGGVALVIRFVFGAGVPQLILAVLIAIGPYIYVLTRARGELEAGVLVRAMKARPSRPGGDDGSIDAAIASIDEDGETVI